MLRLINKQSWLALFILLMATGQKVLAFSMLGQFNAWQTQLLDYRGDAADRITRSGDIGGPMNLGEEYRWNIPRVYYAFNPAFLNYFGQKGVEAVEAAIKIINDLPAVSTFSPDLSEFPLESSRVNYQAAALGVLDMKSATLHVLLEELGLASPENFVWCLRDHIHYPGDIWDVTVIKRNFDPITWNPSSYVNGTLYTYDIIHIPQNPHVVTAVPSVVDPTAFANTSVANYYSAFRPGTFFMGLTRDDVGGLRYIYRTNNFNTETLTNVLAAGLLGAGGSGFPWTPISGTNVFGTNALGTNLTNYVATALRPGIEKVIFVRANYDQFLGDTFTPITNTFTDVFYSNNVPVRQLLQRVVNAPDFIFSAADAYPAISSGVGRNAAWSTADGSFGPGNINPSVIITFSKLGQLLYHSGPSAFLNEAGAMAFPIWGSYDGSTNEPVIFPSGLSIKDLERRALGGI